jgi:hypothetical protein
MFHVVVEYCRMKTISLWIQHGADPNIRDSWSETPIEAARRARREDVVKYLNSISPRNPPLESEGYREAVKEREKREERKRQTEDLTASVRSLMIFRKEDGTMGAAIS